MCRVVHNLDCKTGKNASFRGANLNEKWDSGFPLCESRKKRFVARLLKGFYSSISYSRLCNSKLVASFNLDDDSNVACACCALPPPFPSI